MEDYAYIVDYTPSGIEGKPTVILVGDKNFTILKATVKPGKEVKLYEKVFIGKGEREKIDKIKAKLDINNLPTEIQENVLEAIKKIVKEREEFFMKFLNNVQPISARLHPLELIPGIGKKNLALVLEERKKKPFEGFEDVKKRVPSWQDPISSFAQRIFLELKGSERHYLFVLPKINTKYKR